MRGKAQAVRASRVLKEAYPYERWSREDHAGDPGIVRGVPVALQEVPGHDVPLHPCHGRQGKPTAGHRVPRRIDGWIGHALQILVEADAVLSPSASATVQAKSYLSGPDPGALTTKSA